MEYRTLPHGTEKLSVTGLGLGNIQETEKGEVEQTIGFAIEHGINFFDLCCDTVDVFRAFGRAVSGKRDSIYTQMHFGAVYDKNGKYGYGRNIEQVKASFETVLNAAHLGYTDFGYIHCLDEDSDFDEVMKKGGIFDYMQSLKKQGIIRHLGFSSHTPSVARRMLETGMADCFMFSINAAYDYTKGEFAHGKVTERSALYMEALKLGVGITVMKPFAGGQLLDKAQSPIGIALTRTQCIQYVLDRPAVLACVPGAGSVQDVKDILRYFDAADSEKDYSVLGSAAPADAEGRCVYCNHCLPCPAGIDIGLVNKYYDLAKAGDTRACSHYGKLSVRADACLVCGHCDIRCPFGVGQMQRMKAIHSYFSR